MADVRVGIVSWNVAADLSRCLAALPPALGDLEAEVVVVDNASSDGSAEIAAGFGGVEVVRSSHNVGYARAMNRALAGTEARALIALNPDTEPTPGSLEALVHVLDEHPDVALAAPRLVDAADRTEHSVHRFPTLGVVAVANLVPGSLLGERTRDALWLEGAVRAGRSGPVDWVTGAVHCIRRAALAGAPPYRERWFMYVEDVDLCRRLRQWGWEVHFAAEVVVRHAGNVSGAQAFGAARRARWLRETYDWYELEFGAARTRVYAALNLSGEIVYALGRVPGALRPGPAGRRWRRHLRRVLAPLLVHLRTLLFGAAPPAAPP